MTNSHGSITEACMVHYKACAVYSTTIYSFCWPLSSYYLVLIRPHLEYHIHCLGTARLAMPLQGLNRLPPICYLCACVAPLSMRSLLSSMLVLEDLEVPYAWCEILQITTLTTLQPFVLHFNTFMIVGLSFWVSAMMSCLTM